MASSTLPVSQGAINGARSAFENHIQENGFGYKSGGLNVRSTEVAREPLRNTSANSKASQDPSNSAAAPYNRTEQLGKGSTAMSRSGSEADSLLDLYHRGNSDSNLKPDTLDHDIPENMYQPTDDDPEGWIHRDKLAKIESEELQAAGINLANARRNVRPSKKSSISMEPPPETQPSKTLHEDKRRRISSPIAEDDADRHDWDLRSPEEIAADEATSTPSYPTPVLRKPGSRIPILASSPLPLSSERTGRETPTSRKRTLSGGLSADEAGLSPGRRRRNNSLDAQPLLDEVNDTPVTQSNGKGIPSDSRSSPTKPKGLSNIATPSSAPSTVRKTTPTARKPSSTTKAGTPTSPTQRPGTRSGEPERPRTALNRPEGEAPWLATMYKPDPRLPPDQQIIPTHARRQQQEQWTQDGAIPDTYARDFTPLSVRPNPEHAPPTEPPSAYLPSKKPEEPDTSTNAWPLKPVPSPQNTNSVRPGTSGSITGGYSTMPKVASPPIGISSPKVGQSPRVSNTPGQQRLQEQKMNAMDVEEEDKESKGCGCCIVM